MHVHRKVVLPCLVQPWDFPRPHELFLLEIAISQCFCWASQLLSGIPRRYNLFYWASKLPSGTFPAALKTLKPPSSFAMGLPEAPRTVSVGNCHLAVFLLGFEAAIWHLRRATTCFYWASKLPSGTFPAALKTLKPPSSFAMGLPKAPRTVSVGNCHLAVFLLGFAAAIWHSEALQPVLLGFETAIRHVSRSSLNP